ncbi:hypothetical protein NIES46_32190 [Arthrospira platensis NIES-46]|uniref:Uncharacterized protein n=1 Tax=Limnospira platensis NIES-46 TaxID=1236695 RepID=A0A5M3T8F4_LIMPL|nr:hypothetical protein NIES39_D00040 [Arthrospira platensis NIES-39]GCE95157.1 hypothetical protein NIES46_32190 [Arthrospira platensis NIES-46]
MICKRCWVPLRFSQPTLLGSATLLPTYLGVGFRYASPNLLSQPTWVLGFATLHPTYLGVGFRCTSPNLLSQPALLGFAALLPTYSPNLLCWVSLRFSQPTLPTCSVGFRCASPNLLSTLPTYLGVGFRCASPNLLSQTALLGFAALLPTYSPNLLATLLVFGGAGGGVVSNGKNIDHVR